MTSSTASSPALAYAGVAWTGTDFVDVSGDSENLKSLTSPYGLPWTAHNIPFLVEAETTIGPYAVSGLKWTGSQFFANGCFPVNYSCEVFTSRDGIVWSVATANSGYPLFSFASNGSRVVGVGSAGGLAPVILSLP